jgi:hypothetical protein
MNPLRRLARLCRRYSLVSIFKPLRRPSFPVDARLEARLEAARAARAERV